MANLCNFIARVQGDKANVKKFIEAMEHKNGVWLGRGAELSIVDDDDFNDTWNDRDSSIEFSGVCSWSIENSMVNNALSMREQAETGKGMWGNLVEGTEYYTLFEYARKLGVEFEMYSTESGLGFAEHVSFIDDKELTQTTAYSEIWIGDYENLEQCQKDYPEVTQEMWDSSEDGTTIVVGGFDESVWNL